jgi:hypothetical protein
MISIGGDPKIYMHEHLEFQGDSIIMRYMGFEKFRSLLVDGLPLTRADNFAKDDPFEGEFIDKIYEIAREHKISGTSSRKTMLTYALKKEAMEALKLSYVSCWTLSDHENVALWRLYGNIAVQTTVSDLKKSVENFLATSREEKDIHMKYLRKEMFAVDYIDYRTTDENMVREMIKSGPGKLLYYKNVGYKYEGEVRLIFDGIEQGRKAVARKIGQRCYVLIKPQDFVHKIIVSPFAGNSFFNRVKNELELHGPEIHEMSNSVVWSSLKFPPGTEKTEIKS